MKTLFIGGNGNISWWCVQKALEQGHEVYELNRGMTRATQRAVQPEVRQILADARDEKAMAQALEALSFDAVCDFICMNEAHAMRAIHLFSGKTDQYIFISSEAVYRRESSSLPFQENAPQYDPDVPDTYVAGKIMAERTFRKAAEESGFPITIVRPGFTYDTILQTPVGQNCFTAPRKFLAGYPFLVPGDGENLVAPLHSMDFAEAFVKLIGNAAAIGEDYHIAAEKVITLNEMATEILGALGADRKNILHIPRNEALKITCFYSEIVNQQHMWHYLFNVSKIKSIAPDWRQAVPFSEGIRKTVEWLLEDPVRQRVDMERDRNLTELYKRYWNGGEAIELSDLRERR